MLYIAKQSLLVFPRRLSRGLAATIRRNNSSNSAAYDGDGKTTVRVLNTEEENINLINSYSEKGFRLSNKLFIHGSILIFPTNVFSWTVKRGHEITLDSLLVFDLIVPKTKIVVIGYGQQGEPHDSSLPLKLKRKGISCEMLPTPNAISTYNFLVADSVHVAGAFIPVHEEVQMMGFDKRMLFEEDAALKQPNELNYIERESLSIKEAHAHEFRKKGTKGFPSYEK